MKKHNHNHAGSGKKGEADSRRSRARQLHKDWRTWLVIVVMLAAIGIYVLTLDDSIQPASQTGGQGAASTAPSKP